jgi:cobalt-zinc-cadmium efflux system outer membrane protein
MKYLGAIALLLLSVLPAEQFVSVFRGAQAFALEQRLTLNEAITLALQRHPLLTAARQRIEVARGGLVSAKALPNPSLTAVPFGVPESKPLLLQQPIELPFKRTVRIKTAESEINAALADYRTVELDVIFAVKVAYVNLQAAVAVYRLTEEAVATARTLHDLAQKQFTLGAVPFVHVTRTEIERQRIEQELVQAQAEVAAKQVALNVALGREPSVPVLPADDLAYQPVTVSLEALKALALQRRPEIVAAQSRLVARQFAVKSARAQWLPDFLLLAHFGESERALRVTAPRLAVGIALPFFDFGRIHGEIRAAKAQVTEQEALLEQTKRVILAEVETAVKKLTASQIVVEGFQKRIVPAAEDLLKRVQASYAEGGSTLLEVLDAQQTWRTTRKELVKAIADYLKALAELERAIGGTLPVTGETANGKGTNGEG